MDRMRKISPEDSKQILLFMLVFLIICVILYYFISSKSEGFANKDDFKSEKEYKAQVKKLTNKYNPYSSAKRPVSALLETNVMPEEHQSLVNFYALGCRFSGYIGPMLNGYFDPDIAIQTAVNAGCRVFVLDIDYLKDCTKNRFFPRLVVRDIQGKLVMNYDSTQPFCNSPQESNIRDVCDKINTYAFSPSAQNASDPVIIVLYFLRHPPGSYKSKTVLDYYSNVAKALAPLQQRFLMNELDGGTYYRQKQEGRLLMNKITNYNGKVLIFSNANTSGFRENQTYSASEDLDYLTNLRLSYTQTKLGITENDSGPTFGILQPAEDYLIIPKDRQDQILEQTKLKWTICLPQDPSVPVSKETATQITNTYGVHCVPITLFDDKNDFMFTDKTFRTYSFIPKPEPLRYIKPPIITPAEPNPSMNANQGKLRAPTI